MGQMTEMSQEWYRKMMNDSAELIKMSCQPQYQQLDFSAYITQSQPISIPQQPLDQIGVNPDDDTFFLFNSLPNDPTLIPDFDTTNFLSGSLLYTPDASGNSSVMPSCNSPIKEVFSTGVFQPPLASSRGRKYHNTNLLAQYCQEVLYVTAHPSLCQIGNIVEKLKNSGSNLQEKKLRSSVREWFRKRREYMASKIYRSCQRLLPACPFKGGKQSEKMTNFLYKVHSNTSLIGIIMLESKLPMQSETEQLDFIKEKVTDFYLKYPQRKLRNFNGVKKFISIQPDGEGEEEDEGFNLSQEALDCFLSERQ